MASKYKSVAEFGEQSKVNENIHLWSIQYQEARSFTVGFKCLSPGLGRCKMPGSGPPRAHTLTFHVISPHDLSHTRRSCFMSTQGCKVYIPSQCWAVFPLLTWPSGVTCTVVCCSRQSPGFYKVQEREAQIPRSHHRWIKSTAWEAYMGRGTNSLAVLCVLTSIPILKKYSLAPSPTLKHVSVPPVQKKKMSQSKVR